MAKSRKNSWKQHTDVFRNSMETKYFGYRFQSVKITVNCLWILFTDKGLCFQQTKHLQCRSDDDMILCRKKVQQMHLWFYVQLVQKIFERSLLAVQQPYTKPKGIFWHHKELWREMLSSFVDSLFKVPYGTPIELPHASMWSKLVKIDLKSSLLMLSTPKPILKDFEGYPTRNNTVNIYR